MKNISVKNFWKNIEFYKNLKVDSIQKFLNPECRSSTIFPIYKSSNGKSYISFLTYWVKKNKEQVVLKLIARDIFGKIIEKKWVPITNYFTFNLKLTKFKNFSKKFSGSIEIEIFSSSIPKFTFPAISLFYENLISASVVHSCVRSYNFNEKKTDYAINFPQTGFDVLIGKNKKNYVCFYGGGKQKKYKLIFAIEINNHIIKREIELNNKKYGYQFLFFLEEIFELRVTDVISKVTIYHDIQDIFPRFYVGVFQNKKVPTLTHTFFDTSIKNFKKRELSNVKSLYSKNLSQKKYYDSAFIVPVLTLRSFRTIIKTYSQNLKFTGQVMIKILDSKGNTIVKKIMSKKYSNNWNKNYFFDLSKECLSNNLSLSQNYFCFFGFNSSHLGFPKRFKLGLNIKKTNSEIGTNICFAPNVIDQNIINKPFSRRWFPLGGNPNYIGTLHYTNFHKANKSSSVLFSLEFVNFKGEVHSRKEKMNFNQSLIIDVKKDKTLKSFFKKKIGWCFVTSPTFYFDAYFFSTNKKQVGGDHAF